MVSIIVPVYNSEPFLERCLGSLKCQTYTDLEVIMINEFLDKPEFRQVLEHRAWQGAGRKYAVIGRLLSMNMVTPIIIASKLRK